MNHDYCSKLQLHSNIRKDAYAKRNVNAKLTNLCNSYILTVI